MKQPQDSGPSRMGGKVVPLGRQIHDTAVIHPRAELGVGVEVGPFSVIGDGVIIGDHTSIGPHVVIETGTAIGRNNRICAGAILGNEPQDTKFRGEQTQLVIGDDNIIREYVTMSRGTEPMGGETRIGHHNFIMSNSHIGHDCQLGNHVTMTHGVGLSGCVSVEDHAVIGGMAGIHQFVKVGRMAMIGGCALVTKDVPPFILVSGNPARVYGINVVGLRRNGVSPEVRAEIKRAFKILYRSNLNVSQAIEEMDQQLQACEDIEHFLRFLRNADRGICR